MEDIVRLQQESNDLDAELAAALAEGEDRLLSAHALYETLGTHQIQVASLQPSRPPEHSQSGA